MSAWIHALLEVRFSWFDPRPGLGRRATSTHSGSRLCPRWALPRRSGSWWACRCQSGRTLSSRGGMALCTSPLRKHRKRAIQTQDLCRASVSRRSIGLQFLLVSLFRRNFRIKRRASFGFRTFCCLGCGLIFRWETVAETANPADTSLRPAFFTAEIDRPSSHTSINGRISQGIYWFQPSWWKYYINIMVDKWHLKSTSFFW